MKILRLSLRNLASLAGTHTVDFTREPLRSTGLFSISGPTGAGKSTLLDALCLALYESTPRLAAATGIKLPEAGGEITQKDPGNLLRRGAAEGFAEVVFVGVDGATYTARWEIRRARLRSDGALQNTEMALYHGNVVNGVGGVLAQGGRKSEVLPAIAAKVGLTFAQFTRAVLLAQNDFAVFLKADDKERAQILQALTGTERFERLSIAVFARDRTEREAVQAIQHQLAGHAPLAAEPRAQAESALAAAAASLQQAQEQVRERERQAAWFGRQRELRLAVERAAQARTESAGALAAAAPRRIELENTTEVSREARPLYDDECREIRQQTAARQILAGAAAQLAQTAQRVAERRRLLVEAETAVGTAQRAVDGAAAGLARARTLDAQLEPLTRRLAETQREREAAEQVGRQAALKAEQLRQSVLQLEKARAGIEEQRQRLAALAPLLVDAPAWIERLTATLSARRAEERSRKEHDAKTAAAAEAGAALEKAKVHLAGCATVLEQSAAVRLAVETALKVFDPDALAAARGKLDSAHAALGAWQAQLAKLSDLSARHSTLQSELAQLASETAQATQTLGELGATRLPAALAAWGATKEARAAAEAAVGNAAGVLRDHLRPQQPCPVCGATDHPFALHPPVADAALEALRQTEEEKKQAHDLLRAGMTRLEATLELNGKRATAGAATLAGLAAQMDRERQLVPDHPMVVELSSGPAPGHAAAVASRLTELAAERDALSQREAEHRQAAKAQAAAAKRHEAALAAVAASEKTLSALQARHAAAVSAREAARETLQRAGGELANAQAALEPLFALLPAGARDAFERDAAAQIQVFNEDTQALRALDQQAGEAAQRAATTIVERDGAIQEEITAREVLAKRREEETAVRREHDTLRGERAGLLGGRAADAVERELRLALAQAGQRREVATAALNVAEKEGAAAAEAARAAETAVSEGAVRQEAARRALEEWLAAFAVRTSRSLDRAALRMLLARDENWFRAERAALDSLAAAVSTAEGVHQAGTHALADHAAVRPTAEDESSVMADLAQRQTARVEAERQHVAAAAEISADDRRRLECAALLEKLTAQQTRAEPWGKLNELIGSADGAKFRGIAQRRTLDLLLGFANAQLELLAARYRLERLPESLNLVVLDRDMADERRSVHSLSGGESFLVSLALALGLASLTSNRIRIESLFIDEGFGSLDSATLNTAMNALMQLEAQGRKVGVISHVTEMADAIPVQIRVVRGRAGAARLLVPGAEPNAEEGAAESGATAHGSDPDVDVAQLAERLLGILRREKTAGVSWVSSISLRRELGCEPRDFSAAREALGDQVLTQGKSMGLR